MVNPIVLSTSEHSVGRHNLNIESSRARLVNSRSSENLSTVCIIHTSGFVPAKAVSNWLNLAPGMNQRFLPILTQEDDKSIAYNNIISQVLNGPMSSSCKYILTMEDTVVPPFDGLLKLYENIGKFDVVGGLIWGTGIENSQALVYGSPHQIPLHFLPVSPEQDTVMKCRGLSTGFTLFKLDLFRDKRVPSPWFRTRKNDVPDMFFFENIGKFGYKVACDTRVKIGHYSTKDEIVW